MASTSSVLALVAILLVVSAQAAEHRHSKSLLQRSAKKAKMHSLEMLEMQATRRDAIFGISDADDDDDDEEADEEQAASEAAVLKEAEEKVTMEAQHGQVLAPAKKEKKAQEKAPAAPKEDKQEDEQEDEQEDDEEDDEDDKAAQADVEAAQHKVKAAQNDLETFNNDKAFDDKMASQVKMMANETQSPTLSSFLGAFRREMRAYAKPAYPEYLEGKVEKAEKRVKELEAELKEKDDAETKQSKDEESKTKSAGKEGEVAKLAKESESFSAEDVAQKAGETWALSFFANIVLISVVFAMASTSNTMVKNYTWFLIDQVIAIFLAVMYFQAFGSLMDFHAMGIHGALLTCILHALALLGMVLLLSYYLRGNELGLAILCGAGAHIVSFSSIHAAATLQQHWLGMSYSWLMCLFGMAVLGLGLGIVGYLVHTGKKRADMLQHSAFMDKTDDLENDFGAMAFSVVFTMFVRFVLTGHHPVDDETGFDHTADQRASMLLYACLCLLVACVSIKYCTQKAMESNSYATKRVYTFLNTVASMNVAWALLYWGEWEFFGALYPGEAIKGRVMFAICCTIACGLGLIALTKVPSPSSKVGTGKSDKMVALTAMSLVCAWSWELCFDAAVEDMTAGVAHPVGWKIATTLALFAIVIPVYALYVKPITGPAAEAIGA